MNINISIQKRHLYLFSLLILAFGTIIFVQGQGVSNFGHTSDQIDGLDTLVPTGMVSIFTTDCPSGWTRYSQLDGKFPRGANFASYGLTGGSNEYRIQIYKVGTDYGSHSPMVRQVKYEWKDESSSSAAAQGSDGWYTGPWAVHNPPFFNVVYCRKN